MRQRSKAELLNRLKTYQAIKKDEERGVEVRCKTVYWRMGVEWSTVLWKTENFSANEIVKFLRYIADSGVERLPEERREEIRRKLLGKVEWTFKNSVKLIQKGNDIDIEMNRLEYHNTQVSVDYSLLACEYLMNQKGYSTKRLNRVVADVHYLDTQDATVIWEARQKLYEEKGIWIELNDDKPENVEVEI